MKRLLPPLLFLICLIAMGLLHLFYPIRHTGTHYFAGPFFLLFGALLTLLSGRYFHKIGTNIRTFDAPGKLVTGGFFRYTRNPMYLGFTCMLFGVAALSGALSTLVPVLVFFLAANYWYIPFEERKMIETFGEDYLAYRKKVRRWV